MNDISSKLVRDAVQEFSKLPGIGAKTALRLVLHLLRQDVNTSVLLGNAIVNLRTNIQFCRQCHNISDTDVCHICSNTQRDDSLICVVENIKDVMVIENTGQFKGKFHVLGGIISPMDGVGPSHLNIESLEKRIEEFHVKEVIFALPTTMEGDTTSFYIYKKLKPYNLNITTLARGVAIGDDLEYTDEITLGRSLLNRVAYSV